MHVSFARRWSPLLILAALAPGCGRDPFVPGRKAKPAASSVATDRPKPTYIVYVVPGAPNNDLVAWGHRAQDIANNLHSIFRMMGPKPGDPDSEQLDVIRRALEDGATSLIVYPGSSPDLPRVLADVEKKGIPVVLLSKGLEAPAGEKPFTLVRHAPFEPGAREIVAAIREDLKKISKPEGGTALVMADKVTDDASGRRVAALKSAAEAGRFSQVVMVPYDSSTEEGPKRAVLEAVKAHPDVVAVLADDAEGLFGAANARIESKAQPIFFVGGYVDVRTSSALMEPLRESCFVEGRFEELGGLAVLTALARLRGEPVDQVSALQTRFKKAEGAVWTEGQTVTPVLNKYGYDNTKDAAKEKAAQKEAIEKSAGPTKPQ